jgi:uncharacterized repeat protein (TIGR03803 family)
MSSPESPGTASTTLTIDRQKPPADKRRPPERNACNTLSLPFASSLNTGDLVRDSAGNLYGTTYYGGIGSGLGKGTVFRLSKSDNTTVLHKFTGPPDGLHPGAGLLRSSSGVLYGTTLSGGAVGSCSNQKPEGCGVILELSKSGAEKVLYRFTGGGDGGNPEGDLIQDKSGNLYGVTFAGGDLSCNQPYGCGVVFKLDSHGNEKALYRFRGGKDGWAPKRIVARESEGRNGAGEANWEACWSTCVAADSMKQISRE